MAENLGLKLGAKEADPLKDIASHATGRGTGDATVTIRAEIGAYYAIGMGFRNIESGSSNSTYGGRVTGGTVLLSKGGSSGTNGGGGLVIIKATSTTVKVSGGGVGWVKLSA